MATRAGVLLIHGFTGSPAEMQWLSQQLQNVGYETSTPTLCGHGDRPEAMLNCSYQDWIRDVESALGALQRDHDKLFVVGLSMGGALALHLASANHIAGVVTLAAVSRLSPLQALAARLLCHLIPWREKANGSDIRDQEAKKRLNSYNRYPTRAVVELLKLLKQVRSEIPKIRVPILILHSKQDHAVPVKNAYRIYREVQSRKKKLRILENSYHILPLDVEKHIVFKEIEQFFEQVMQETHE